MCLTCDCCLFLSSSGDGSVSEGTPELLVQSEGVLPGQDHGGCPVPGRIQFENIFECLRKIFITKIEDTFEHLGRKSNI